MLYYTNFDKKKLLYCLYSKGITNNIVYSIKKIKNEDISINRTSTHETLNTSFLRPIF